MIFPKECLRRCFQIFRGDQTDDAFLERVVAAIPARADGSASTGGPYDVIIDDGSHHPAHQLASFRFLFLRGLAAGGTYVIEDTETSYWEHSEGYGLDSMAGLPLDDIAYGLSHPLSTINVFRALAHITINGDFLTPAMRERHAKEHPGLDEAVPAEVRQRIATITFARNCVLVTKKEAAHDRFVSKWHREISHIASKH